MYITAKITQNGNCNSSSPETSSDECSEDNHNVIDSANAELEIGLPSIVCFVM